MRNNLVFFDDKAILKAVDKGTRKALSKWGAYVRSDARRSLRNAKKNRPNSRPGEPPRLHTGELKRFLFFAYDLASKSVVVGPQKLTKLGSAPETLEYGE